MIEIVAVDIGGTHARFALAEIDRQKVIRLGPETVLRTADHASLGSAWAAFARAAGHPLPRAAAIAVAAPVRGELLQLTNNPWTLRPAEIARELGVGQTTLVNDFAAVAHAVTQLGAEHLRDICGPGGQLPDRGVISVVGPGTGLGVAMLLRTGEGAHVVPTEGGHIAFAPIDGFDDALLNRLRQRHRRVSAERVVAGPGLAAIYENLAGIEGQTVAPRDDKALWAAALADEDRLSAAVLDRFCTSLGAVAGDIALAQGASGVVLAGGLGLRLADRLPRSGFARGFVAKGRFEPLMASIPVKLITHPQPGLLGAAAAFAEEHS